MPPEKLFRNIELGFHDPYTIPPVPKAIFQAKKAMYAYPDIPIDPVIENETSGGRDWKRQTVSINAAYNKERLILKIDLPIAQKPPYETVIYFPGGNGFKIPKFALNPLWEPWDGIVKSGRAVITPVFSGMFERGGGSSDQWLYKGFATLFSEWVQDLQRTIDYLETRKDMDTQNIAYLGLSWGGVMGPALAAFVDRIRVVILVGGGILLPKTRPKPSGLNLYHCTVPILMLNGKQDMLLPLDTHQKPMFDLVGTPSAHKKHILFDAGHVPLPRGPMLKEIIAWLDKYQGPVGGKSRQ
jgi:predicted esterase